MFKIFLGIMIILCSTLLGMQMAKTYVMRVKEIRLLQSAFAHLETEMVHYYTMLPEALDKVGRSLHGYLGKFFCHVSRNLTKRNGYAISDIWEQSLMENKEYLHLLQEDIDILIAFGDRIGISDRQSQQKYFELVQMQLRNQEKKAEEACSKYERMYRSLGILGGLALVIILF